MIGLLQVLLFALVAASAPAVVLARDPRAQIVSLSFYGLVLALVFFVHQAPDVALSQLAIGAVALPILVLLALARIRRDAERRKRAEEAR